MSRILKFWLGAMFVAIATTAGAAEDVRRPVEMPPEARAELRAEMLGFVTGLNQIVTALADGRHDEAADVAESKLGLSSMGRHRDAPMNARPGRYMPPEMHAIGRGLHANASEFAKVARNGDTVRALAALKSVTGACAACHGSYRIQ